MDDAEVLSRVTYGLYLVCSGNRDKGNGFISNTVFQVSSKPVKFALCCNKANLTADFIKEYKTFSVSILSIHTLASLFGTFGYTSGRDTDKFKGIEILYGNTGVPIVLNSCIAWLELRLEQTVDAGTHFIFIGELVNSAMINDAEDPITYNYYRHVLKAFAPKNAPTYIENAELLNKHTGDKLKKYVCPECGYVYDEANENVRFADLPEDWVCPVCGTPKSEFVEIL